MDNFMEITPEQMGQNPFKMIGKDWMLITAKTGDKVNTMTASWGGLGVMWHKNVAFIVIRPQRYTKEFVDNSDTLSLSFLDDSYKKALSYIGKVSGRDEDKITNANLTVRYADETPYFEQANTVLICKKLFAQQYDEQSFIDTEILEKMYPNHDLHTLYIVEITKVLTKK